MEAPAQIENDQPPIGIAGFAGLTCMVLTWWLASFAGSRLNADWLVWPLALLIPLAATFSVLYRSRWHRELPVFTRVLSMLLSAAIIYVVAVGALAMVFAAICIFIAGDLVSG